MFNYKRGHNTTISSKCIYLDYTMFNYKLKAYLLCIKHKCYLDYTMFNYKPHNVWYYLIVDEI